MNKIILTIVIGISFNYLNAQVTELVYRSEYENVGDVIYDINDPNEGSISYSIISGNSNGYYSINKNNGQITIAKTIADTFNVVHSDTLTIDAGSNLYIITIVDGYDYFISNLSSEYSILDKSNGIYIDSLSKWTAFNNLWGKGTAVPNVDFRIAIIHKKNLPDSTILIWDVPGMASDFGGASVWCYHNIFWGNRKGIREDLLDFPFKINSINNLNYQFDFHQIFGNDQFKLAMNMFMTNEPYLTNFSNNAGDFFFVFDQNGTWIPPYPYSLPDTTILGKPFALRYDDSLNGAFYERRRVIIKDNEELMSGTVDIKDVFNTFINKGYLNIEQSIYHIQIGIEVTSGYGAVAINQSNIQLNQVITGIEENTFDEIKVYPNPTTNNLIIDGNLDKLGDIKIYDILGQEIEYSLNKNIINMSHFPPGMYIIKTKTTAIKVHKK